MAYAAALAAMVDELDGWIARHDARIDAWHEGILYARAGEWQPGPDDETFRLLREARLRRPAAARGRRRGAGGRRLAALRRRRGHAGPHRAPAGQARPRAAPRAARARRAHLRGHADGARARPAGRPRVVTPAGVVAQAAWCSRTGRGRRGSGTSAAPSPCAPTSWSSPSRSPSSSSRSAGRRHMGVADLREMLYYLRRTADDRIAIGGGAMGIVLRRAHPRPRAHVAAAGGGRRARPDLAVPAARGRALRRRLERPHGHHRPGAAVLRVGAGRHASTPASASPATASRAPGSAARSSPRWCSAPTTSGAACRSSARRSRSCRPSRCAGRSCSR